jgi:DNA polymerase-3 subunit gamma/tau
VDFAEVIARLDWICRQEGIATDPEVLAVLAQAGEGSVRDSLSALDQAIACCGTTLSATEVRPLLGLFSLESLDRVTDALRHGDSRRMLEIVQDLERNGRHLQHFCRELARYFRNLLVSKIAGGASRLIAASDREQARLAEIAAFFSEEDLTRYLQLTLDLFRELQFSLQPRLHLELGLLKLVHAGRLLAIEEALAMVGPEHAPPPKSPAMPPASPSGSGATPRATPRSAELIPPAPEGNSVKEAESGISGFQERLHAALIEEGKTFIADAVEHASITEAEGEVRFVAGREFLLALQSGELQAIVHKLAGRPLRVKVTAGENSVHPAIEHRSRENDDEAARRAFAHPEVQRFQQMFPGSQVRAVRNLRES